MRYNAKSGLHAASEKTRVKNSGQTGIPQCRKKRLRAVRDGTQPASTALGEMRWRRALSSLGKAGEKCADDARSLETSRSPRPHCALAALGALPVRTPVGYRAGRLQPRRHRLGFLSTR